MLRGIAALVLLSNFDVVFRSKGSLPRMVSGSMALKDGEGKWERNCRCAL